MLIAPIFLSLIIQAVGSHHSYNISSTGSINYSPIVVKVDYGNRTSINGLTLGTQINDWAEFPYKQVPMDKAKAVNLGLIRIFVGGSGDFIVCTNWNEATRTGTYDWTRFDGIIQAIFDVGAEPLVTIGGDNRLPSGMSVNSASEEGYPLDPKDFAKYCADIVRHCDIEKGWGIKYWEIWNEPIWYNRNSITEFVSIFNEAQAQMHAVDPSILCGNDMSNIKNWFEDYLANAQGMGFLSFHKYCTGRNEYYKPPPEDDSVVMARAGELTWYGDIANFAYPPSEIRSRWYEKRGELLPVICSETNVNWCYWGANYEWVGTDPRQQTAFGSAWYAEELRAFILDGVSSSIYYVFASNDESIPSKPSTWTGGMGYGMMRSDSPYELCYPYFTNLLIGNNLDAGDEIFESSSSNFTAVSSLAWIHDGSYKILLIGKTSDSVLVTVDVTGNVNGTKPVLIQRIEGSGIEGGIQESSIPYSNPLEISLNGYSVTLLTISLLF